MKNRELNVTPWLRHLVSGWIIAVTMHLPLPLCDGDQVGSQNGPQVASHSESHVSGLASLLQIDIDFVLLGCQHPDDPDDGPVDDDPAEQSSTCGPYPIFVKSPSASDQFPDSQRFDRNGFVVASDTQPTRDSIATGGSRSPHWTTFISKWFSAHRHVGVVQIRC